MTRVWRKVKSDWDAWNARSLVDEPIVRLILDGTLVRVRLDGKGFRLGYLRPVRPDLWITTSKTVPRTPSVAYGVLIW